MNIVSLYKFVSNHPLNKKHRFQAILRVTKWQFFSRLMPYPIIYSFTNKAKLIIQKGMTGATGNLYCGLQEFNDMCFLLHFLRESDYFADIGANIGSYTMLASGHIGAKTISAEPVPTTFYHLNNNISINHIQEKVTAFNGAIGDQKGFIEFTQSLDTMNRVAQKDENNTIKVPIISLDELLKGQSIPSLIKIDVEGFETKVIQGASNTLQQNTLKAIIIELNGSGYRYGFDEQNLHNALVDLNFKPFEYNPFTRKLKQLNTYGIHNTIYIRDLEFVKKRISTAKKVELLNQDI